MKSEKKTPRGIRNNNPLNIRVGNDWQGEVEHQTDGQFEQFKTMSMGVRAGFIILRKYINTYHLDTIDSIIKRWAPSNENDTEAYINSVCKYSGLDRFEVLRFEDSEKMFKLFRAMARVENGEVFSLVYTQIGYFLAKVKHPTKK